MKYLKFFENYTNIVLYHGTEDTYENPKTDTRLNGLYCSDDIRAAKIYGDIIWKITPKTDIKIKDLSDGFDLLNYFIDKEIIDKEDIDDDLEGYILSGRLFQYDISSRTHYMDYLVSEVDSEGYDLVKVPDDLQGIGGDIAYIIINIEKFECSCNMLESVELNFLQRKEYLKWKNSRGARVKIFTDSKDGFGEIRGLFPKIDIARKDFKGLSINTGSCWIFLARSNALR